MKINWYLLLVLTVTSAKLSAQTETAVDPYSYQMSYFKGDSLYRAGDYTGAVEQLTVAILTKKSDPDVFLLRAKAYIKIDEIKRAKSDLRSAQRIGNYRADMLLDSLMGKTTGEPKDPEFEKDLEKYLRSTE